MGRIVVVFLRRLWLPVLVFAGFNLLCVCVYMHLEHLRWPDALFWILNPHSINYRTVRDATKFFALFVYGGVFSFQIWIAERVLATVFRKQGLEAWKSMVNDVGIEKLKGHF
ncbi:MAG: hypothetical protein WAL32_14050, partial [Terriglobales bacterium]